MYNKIISFIFGAFLKLVDDNNDMNLFNDKYINIIKVLLAMLALYWINIDFNYCIDMVITCIICYFIKQVDTPYYKIVMLLICLNFFLKFDSNKFTTELMIEKLTIFIVFFSAAYIEHNFFKEEYSKPKLCFRVLGFIATIVYLYVFSYHNNFIENIINKFFYNNKIFTILKPEVDAILIVLGYVFVSIIDISYMLTIK
jgi:hypothetical protein